jgi:hypothetical protein
MSASRSSARGSRRPVPRIAGHASPSDFLHVLIEDPRDDLDDPFVE